MVHVGGDGEGQRKLLTFSNGTGNTSHHEGPEPNHNHNSHHKHGHHPDSLLNSIIKTVFEQNPKETSFGDLLLPQQLQEESTVPLSLHSAISAKCNGFALSCVVEEEPLLNTMTSTHILRGGAENAAAAADQPVNGNANLNLNVVSSTSTSTSTAVNRTSLLQDTHNSNTLNGNRNEVTAINTSTSARIFSTATTTTVKEEIVSKSNGNGNGHSKSEEKASTTKKTSSEKKANGKAGKEKVSQQKKKAKGDRANESPEKCDTEKVPLLASESSASAGTKKSPSKKSSSTPPVRTGESSSSSISVTTTETSSQQPAGAVAPTSSVKTGKLSNGAKNPALKRVSFGNSKGTMVETLIYDSPVSEDQETSKTGGGGPSPSTGNGAASAQTPITNGGGGAGAGPVTPILKTTETNDSIDSTLSGGSTGGSRPPSRVRVTFFESEKPLAVSSPESDFDFDLSHNMTLPGSPSADGSHSYHRQTSGEIGWENPFRPDGDLSREADQIVELIKEGKPINEENLRSKSPAVLNSTSKSFFSKGKGANGTTNGLEVQRGVAAQPNQAGQVEHVNLKKQKKGCCVVQ